MKSLDLLVSKSLVIGLLMPVLIGTATGTSVVVSNLVDSSAGNASRLVNSHGAPLPSGSRICLGHFGTLDSTRIQALAKQGPAALLAAFTVFGAPSTIGTGADSIAGRFEFVESAPLSSPQQGLHVVVFNSPDPATATELLVAALPQGAPADDPSGLVGYLATHIEDSTLVVGTTSNGQLATVSAISAFHAWMTARAASGTSPDDLLPNGDADHDGIPNLVEYALGSNSGSAPSGLASDYDANSDTIHLRFLKRSDDPEIHIIVETNPDLAGDHWSASTEPIVEISSPPSPAPAGYVWMRTDLPASGSKLFARVKVTLGP